jgi:uncharacterized protein (DUF2164 family)
VKHIELKKETKQDIVNSIKQFFVNEQDEEISYFQASLLLDFILAEIGPHIYNQAIADAYSLMSDKLEDLYGLEKKAR